MIDEDDIQMPDQPSDQITNQSKAVEQKAQVSEINKIISNGGSQPKEPKPSIFNSINLSFGKPASTATGNNAFSKFSMLSKVASSSSKTPMPSLKKPTL